MIQILVYITLAILAKETNSQATTLEPGTPSAPKYPYTDAMEEIIWMEEGSNDHFIIRTPTKLLIVDKDMNFVRTSSSSGSTTRMDCYYATCIVQVSSTQFEVHDVVNGAVTHTYDLTSDVISAVHIFPSQDQFLVGFSDGNLRGIRIGISGLLEVFKNVNIDTEKITHISRTGSVFTYVAGFEGGGKTLILEDSMYGVVREYTHSASGDCHYVTHYRSANGEAHYVALIFPNIIDVFSELEESLFKTVTYAASVEWTSAKKMGGSYYTVAVSSDSMVYVVDYDGGMLDSFDLSAFPQVNSITWNKKYTEFAFTYSSEDVLRIKPWSETNPVPSGCAMRTLIRNDGTNNFKVCMDCYPGWLLHESELCFNTASGSSSCLGQEYFAIAQDGTSSGCEDCPGCCLSCSSSSYSSSDIQCSGYEASQYFYEPNQSCEDLSTKFLQPSYISSDSESCTLSIEIDTVVLGPSDLALITPDDLMIANFDDSSLSLTRNHEWSLSSQGKPQLQIDFGYSTDKDLEVEVTLFQITINFGTSLSLDVTPPTVNPTTIQCPANIQNVAQGTYQITAQKQLIKITFSSVISDLDIDLISVDFLDSSTKQPFDYKITVKSETEIDIQISNEEKKYKTQVSIRASIEGDTETFNIEDTVEMNKEYDHPFFEGNKAVLLGTVTAVSESNFILSGFFPALADFFYSFNFMKIICLVPLKMPTFFSTILSSFVDLDGSNLTSMVTRIEDLDKEYIPKNEEFKFKSSYVFRRAINSLQRLLLTLVFIWAKEPSKSKKLLRFILDKLIISHLSSIYFSFCLDLTYIIASLCSGFFVLDLVLIIFDLLVISFNHYTILKFFVKKKNKKINETKIYKGKMMIKIFYQNFADIFGPLPLRLLENYCSSIEVLCLFFIKNSPVFFIASTAGLTSLVKITLALRYSRTFGRIQSAEKSINEVLKSVLLFLLFLSDKNEGLRSSNTMSIVCLAILLAILMIKLLVSIYLYFKVESFKKKRRVGFMKNSQIIDIPYRSPIQNSPAMSRIKKAMKMPKMGKRPALSYANKFKRNNRPEARRINKRKKSLKDILEDSGALGWREKMRTGKFEMAKRKERQRGSVFLFNKD